MVRVETCEADDRGDHSNRTDGEDGQESNFLGLVDLKLEKEANWKEKNDEVRSDIEAGLPEVNGHEVTAVFGPSERPSIRRVLAFEGLERKFSLFVIVKVLAEIIH